MEYKLPERMKKDLTEMIEEQDFGAPRFNYFLYP